MRQVAELADAGSIGQAMICRVSGGRRVVLAGCPAKSINGFENNQNGS